MSEKLIKQTVWHDAAPLYGQEVESHWQLVKDVQFNNPWKNWMRTPGYHLNDVANAEPVSVGLTHEPGQDELVLDEEFQNYRAAFGWANGSGLGSQMFTYDGHVERFVKDVLEHCRFRTFESFRDAKLGITAEFSAKLWVPQDHQNPLDYDVVPHTDWVRQDLPVAIVLSSLTFKGGSSLSQGEQLATNLWEGVYAYRGDLQNSQGYTIDYLESVKNMDLVDSNNAPKGSVWVGDARRALHGRPTMRPNAEPVVRLFMRGFVAPVDRD